MLEIGVRLGRVGIDEDIAIAANRASYLSQRTSDVFVHRHGIVSSRLRIRHVDQTALEVNLLPRQIEQIPTSHAGADRKDHERQQVSTRACQHR